VASHVGGVSHSTRVTGDPYVRYPQVRALRKPAGSDPSGPPCRAFPRAARTPRSRSPAPTEPVTGYGRCMGNDDLPRELRGVSPDPVRESTTPTWVRVVALLLIVALVFYFVISAF